jgi:hypothetical protein
MSTKQERPSDAISLEEELNQTIRQAAPGVVAKVLEKAREGSYLHAKFLFDLAGLDLKRTEDDEESDGESLASFLMKELRESAPDPIS